MAAIFSHNYTLGLIKEVGENNVLVSVNGEDIEVTLNENNREAILDMVTENIYLVPFDTNTNEILMTVDEATLYEIFPETDLPELIDSTEEVEEE